MTKVLPPGKRKTLVIRKLLMAKFGLAAGLPLKRSKKRRSAPKLRRRCKPRPKPKLRPRRSPRPKR